MQEIHKYTTQEATNLQLGQNGFDVVAEHDTNTQATYSGNWIRIIVCYVSASGRSAMYCKL